MKITVREHTCPICSFKWRKEVQKANPPRILGYARVHCPQCGKLSTRYSDPYDIEFNAQLSKEEKSHDKDRKQTL